MLINIYVAISAMTATVAFLTCKSANNKLYHYCRLHNIETSTLERRKNRSESILVYVKFIIVSFVPFFNLLILYTLLFGKITIEDLTGTGTATRVEQLRINLKLSTGDD